MPRDGSKGRDRSAEDESLVREAQRAPGSPLSRSAAADLLERHQEQVYAWCRRYANDRDAALDLAQDVLLTAYQKLPALTTPARFGPWLFSITRNHCINTVTRSRETVELDVKRFVDERASSSADQEVIARENEEQLLEMIAKVLEKIEQDVVWMKYVDGFSIKEIERTLCIDSKSGARSILQRARNKLRRAYGCGNGLDREFSS